MTLLSGLCALLLAIAHLYSGKLHVLDKIPRSRWLSAASGVSVAYVFIHLLPDLSRHQDVLARSTTLAFLEHHVYLMALLGLAIFYGLERLVTESQQRNAPVQPDEELTQASMGIFWVHIVAFALYNALIGYLLVHREEPGLASLIVYTIAIGFHFMVNDYGLRHDHRCTYHNRGRWILAAAIIAGWAIGAGTEIPEAAIAVLFAFLAGGIILNVLKEELPEERQSRFWAFALGTTIYAAMLLMV